LRHRERVGRERVLGLPQHEERRDADADVVRNDVNVVFKLRYFGRTVVEALIVAPCLRWGLQELESLTSEKSSNLKSAKFIILFFEIRIEASLMMSQTVGTDSQTFAKTVKVSGPEPEYL